MFANFFGIVIISASVLFIAGLVLRTTPDLPATMNLGIVEAASEATQQAVTVDTSTSAEATSTETSSTAVETSSSTDTDSTSSESSTVETAATETADETKTVESSEASKVGSTETKVVANESKEAAQAKTPETAREKALRERNLEIRRKAAEAAGSNGTVRINKSDLGRIKN